MADCGTNSGYTAGCRCRPCTLARTRYMRWYQHVTSYGERKLLLPSAESQQQLRDLLGKGWTGPQLGAHLGVNRGRITDWLHQPKITRRNALRIFEMWDALLPIDPPEPTTHRAKIAVNRNRNKFAGKSPTKRSYAETVAEYDHLKSFGLTDETIAERLGVQRDTLITALRRAGRVAA